MPLPTNPVFAKAILNELCYLDADSEKVCKFYVETCIFPLG